MPQSEEDIKETVQDVQGRVQDDIQEPGDGGHHGQDPVMISVQEENVPEIVDITKNKVKIRPQPDQVKKIVKVAVPGRRTAKITDI